MAVGKRLRYHRLATGSALNGAAQLIVRHFPSTTPGRAFRRAGPGVRIRLPPPASLQTPGPCREPDGGEALAKRKGGTARDHLKGCTARGKAIARGLARE